MLVGRFFGMRTASDSPVRTLLRLTDEDGPPLMVARGYGGRGGQVFVIGTSADTYWTNWPTVDNTKDGEYVNEASQLLGFQIVLIHLEPA